MTSAVEAVSALQYRLAGWALVLLCAIAGCTPSGPGDTAKLSGPTMGTAWVVTVAPPPALPQDIDALAAAIKQRLHEINDLMSTYVPESEVSRFGVTTTTDWFDMSGETLGVVKLAQSLAERTGGAFDITVAPLVRLWHFGAGSSQEATLPDRAEIDQMMASVGYQKLTFRDEPPALRKQAAHLEIDLSAIAKGYAVDQIAELLAGRGIENYLVEIGGEVRAAGERPGGGGWRIGIEKPISGARSVQLTRPLRDAALATSGNYRQFYEIAGRSYSHIIDPRQAEPTSHDLVSVSVERPTCAEADALATALYVLGPEAGPAWAEANEIAALFIRRTASGFREIATTRW